ncbi:hypothetical protein F2Q69_00020374 [Brassica cretica]|uniref:Uncharacterized protein n=1 Tax=Brassica cretica TaxID=69181 RepID=A0A8S9QHE9_BRACR|nr:hypothetical protein F2Q69_00020374 [Brassica cretica]
MNLEVTKDGNERRPAKTDLKSDGGGGGDERWWIGEMAMIVVVTSDGVTVTATSSPPPPPLILFNLNLRRTQITLATLVHITKND